jgi:hypothetical protein
MAPMNRATLAEQALGSAVSEQPPHYKHLRALLTCAGWSGRTLGCKDGERVYALAPTLHLSFTTGADGAQQWLAMAREGTGRWLDVTHASGPWWQHVRETLYQGIGLELAEAERLERLRANWTPSSRLR